MNVNQEQGTKLCQMCQNYGDHMTAKCPKLICAECDERGHAKKHCPYLAETESKNSNDEKRRKDLQQRLAQLVTRRPKIQDDLIALEEYSILIKELLTEISKADQTSQTS